MSSCFGRLLPMVVNNKINLRLLVKHSVNGGRRIGVLGAKDILSSEQAVPWK